MRIEIEPIAKLVENVMRQRNDQDVVPEAQVPERFQLWPNGVYEETTRPSPGEKTS